jgi:hypothetical protein
MLRTTRARLERLEDSSLSLPPRLVVLTVPPEATDADRQRHFDWIERVTGRAMSARDVVLVLRRDDAAGREAVTVDGVPI